MTSSSSNEDTQMLRHQLAAVTHMMEAAEHQHQQERQQHEAELESAKQTIISLSKKLDIEVQKHHQQDEELESAKQTMIKRLDMEVQRRREVTEMLEYNLQIMVASMMSSDMGTGVAHRELRSFLDGMQLVENVVHETLDWLDNNPEAETDEREAKQRELKDMVGHLLGIILMSWASRNSCYWTWKPC